MAFLPHVVAELGLAGRLARRQLDVLVLGLLHLGYLVRGGYLHEDLVGADAAQRRGVVVLFAARRTEVADLVVADDGLLEFFIELELSHSGFQIRGFP